MGRPCSGRVLVVVMTRWIEPDPATPGVTWWQVIALWILFFGSLMAAVKIPGTQIGLSNLCIAGASSVLLVGLRREALAVVWQFRSATVIGTLAWAWIGFAALAGPLVQVASRAWVKGLVYLVAGLALVALARRDGRGLRLTVLWFLVALAIGGVAESAWPANPLLELLRSESSLSITPRVASLMPWPNQYGVAMVFAMVLLEGLVRANWGRVTPWLLRVLVLSQVAQSGSRNAWLVFAAALVGLVVARTVPPRRAAIVALLFVAIGVTLPVPARQAGIRTGSWLEPANSLIHEPQGWSPALSPAHQSASLRSKLWRQAADVIRDRPVMGVGPAVFQATRGVEVMGRPGFNTHNLVLEILVSGGVGALVLSVLAAGLVVVGVPPPRLPSAMPLVVVLGGQILDCFLHDPTFVVLGAAAIGWFVAPEDAT